MDPHIAQEVAAGELLESCPAVLMDWGILGLPGERLDIGKHVDIYGC